MSGDDQHRLRMVRPGGLWLGIGQQHRAPTAADLAAYFRGRPELLDEVRELLDCDDAHRDAKPPNVGEPATQADADCDDATPTAGPPARSP